jgi:hypothetical protein
LLRRKPFEPLNLCCSAYYEYSTLAPNMYHFVLVLLSLAMAMSASTAFSFFQAPRPSRSCITSLQVVNDLDRPSTFLDANADDDDDADVDDEPATKPSSRWQSLNPKIKQRLIEKGQAKAIANKAKREPRVDKKRRKQSESIGAGPVRSTCRYNTIRHDTIRKPRVGDV